MKIYDSICETIGDTPLLRLKRIAGSDKAEILLKLEYFNPGSSIKDRIAVAMIDDAEKKGLLKAGGLIVEPTSGNTGLGLAMAAASKGYKTIIVMPDSMSQERILLMRHFGAELVLTPGGDGMAGAVKKAEEIVNSTPGAFMPQQFKNPANVEAHRQTTAPEIIRDTNGRLDIFVAAAGTGGTVSGTGSLLKEISPSVQVFTVEPETSSVLCGGNPGKHNIQGIGAGFVPEILNTKILDGIIAITDKEAIDTARELASKEGVLCGISTGANVAAALKLADMPLNRGKRIVTIACDTGERYLSTELFRRD